LREDENSILTLYQRLIDYRKNHPSLAIGDYETVASPAGTFVYRRNHADEQHLILLNFTADEQLITLPDAGEIVLDTTLAQAGRVTGEFQLAGDTGVIIRIASQENGV
jgi:alpha-glucosidase